jgi:uncharacterized iron-regulated membrane protein
MTFRKVLFWSHLCAGVVGGIVILIMSITGALLTFEQTILRAVERDQRLVELPAAGVGRVSIETVLAAARSAVPDAQPMSVTFEANPRSSVAVGLGLSGTAFVNPYTGEVLGTGSTRARNFYRAVTNWHRYLAMSGDQRTLGKGITGACNAAFLVLAVSGLYLWMPRQWSWRHVAPVIWFRRGLMAKARDFNWHNSIGLWCAPVIIVLTATGMVMSYTWANNLVYTLTGSPVPAPPAGRGGPGPSAGPGAPDRGGRGGRGGSGGQGFRRTLPASVSPAPRSGAELRGPEPRSSDTLALDALLAVAARQMPTWSTISMRVSQAGAPVTFSMTDGEYWNAFARSTLTLDARTGGVVRWEPYSKATLGQKARGWMRFAHTGELAGLAGEAVAGIACVGGSFLVWTGIALSLRRFAAWRQRSSSRVQVPAVAMMSETER